MENTLIINSCAKSIEVQGTSIGIRMAYLENQSITTRIESDDADVGRSSIKFMKIDFHEWSRMRSCWRVP